MADLDTQQFVDRMSKILEAWEAGFETEGSPWHQVDVFALVHGKSSEVMACPKTAAAQSWLTGWELPDTVTLFGRDGKILFVTGPKKITALSPVKDAWEASKEGRTMELVPKPASQEESKKAFGSFCESEDTILGVIPVKAQPEGELAIAFQAWREGCKEGTERSVSAGISRLLATRAEGEEANVKAAAAVTAQVAKTVLLKRLMDVIDSEEKESHDALATRGWTCLDAKDEKYKKWREKTKEKILKETGVTPELTETEVTFSLIQSQESDFTFRILAENSDKPVSLDPGCLVTAFGCKHNDINTAVARTLLVDPPLPDMKTTYAVLQQAVDKAIDLLRPGVKCSDVYNGVIECIRESAHPELVEKIGKTVGYLTGHETRDNTCTLSATCQETVPSRSVFFVNIFMGPLGPEEKPYGLWLGDTVMVSGSGEEPAQLLTGAVQRSVSKVTLEFQGDGDGDEEGGGAANGAQRNGAANGRDGERANGVSSSAAAGRTSTSSRVKDEEGKSKGMAVLRGEQQEILERRLRARPGREGRNEDTLREMNNQQAELRDKKMEEIRERLASGEDMLGGGHKKQVKKLSAYNAYPDGNIPREARRGRLQVDDHHDALLVPVGSFVVPFHASTIKNVVAVADEAQQMTLRVNFQIPNLTGKDPENKLPDLSRKPKSLFVKELVFRGSQKHMEKVTSDVKALLKKVREKERLELERKDLVEQEALLSSKSMRRLPNLMIRPNIDGTKRLVGELQAHANGLRFYSSRAKESVDIIYTNIKHLFFQEAKKEAIVILHFHLKNPIMVGKKKTHDIQVFREAGVQADDLDKRRAGGYRDPDEIEEEQRERELRRRINKEFKIFIEQAIEPKYGRKAEEMFDALAFQGNPNRSMVELRPTTNCLVHIVEWPPFVACLDDIEIAAFERVFPGAKAFDMVLVFKDWEKPVKKIDQIPMESLDMIKRWLNDMSIVWYEGHATLNWKTVCNEAVKDRNNFVENGAFSQFFVIDGEESSDEDGESSNYTEDSDGDEDDYSDDEDDSDDDESLATEDESDSEASLGSDESEGMDWDELEEEAIRHDRKRNDIDKDEDDRRSKKRRTGSAPQKKGQKRGR